MDVIPSATLHDTCVITINACALIVTNAIFAWGGAGGSHYQEHGA